MIEKIVVIILAALLVAAWFIGIAALSLYNGGGIG